MIRFVIEGEPVAKGRPKLSRWGTYTPKKTKDYEEYIKKEWLKTGINCPLEGPLKVSIVFIRRIQKNCRKAEKTAKINGTIKPIIKPDLDNYIKAVLDGLNGLAYKDDSQICELSAEKIYGIEPKTIVVIEQVI